MTDLTDAIAREMMDTIERERRINLDDLRLAAERVLQRCSPLTLGRISGFDRARGLDHTGVWINKASMFPPPPDVHADTQVGMIASAWMRKWVEKQRLAMEHDEQEELLKAMERANADKIVNPPVVAATVDRSPWSVDKT
jgi:hypothetical protein